MKNMLGTERIPLTATINGKEETVGFLVVEITGPFEEVPELTGCHHNTKGNFCKKCFKEFRKWQKHINETKQHEKKTTYKS